MGSGITLIYVVDIIGGYQWQVQLSVEVIGCSNLQRRFLYPKVKIL